MYSTIALCINNKSKQPKYLILGERLCKLRDIQWKFLLLPMTVIKVM